MSTKIWTLLQGDNTSTDKFPVGNCKMIGVFTDRKKALTAARFLIALNTEKNFDLRDYDYDIDAAQWIDEQVAEIDETGRTTEGSVAFMLYETFTDVIDVDILDV